MFSRRPPRLFKLHTVVAVLAATIVTIWGITSGVRPGANRDIAFFGRVVDQDGSPIAGAVVTAELTRKAGPELPILWSSPNNRYVVVTTSTDSQGSFAFEVKGIGLLIRSVEKAGYAGSRSNTGNVEYLRPKDEWYTPLRSNRSNPHIFTLRRRSDQ